MTTCTVALMLSLNAVAGSSPDRDLAAEVHSVFAAKCAGCHGANLAKPRGRFGYVLDLERIAHNPEMVVPGRPLESELWLLVENEEMPPPEAPRGPLSAAQKQVIRAWIEAGAPSKSAPGASTSTSDSASSDKAASRDSHAR